ncbi:hypothetical protein [Nocardioides sp. REDSEA-S30_B4]|uniref:hypothetical protein n=1 Tax=Nocardioides sp. REDSEA-S30_B4 TaxID=1811552 RepID=UPI000B15797D|nr:hypothetical protein [Nocardioides sp. REDSEA-S30_B4]
MTERTNGAEVTRGPPIVHRSDPWSGPPQGDDEGAATGSLVPRFVPSAPDPPAPPLGRHPCTAPSPPPPARSTAHSTARWLGCSSAPETIVKVTGNASEGFGIEHYDGSSTFPPTHSEAMAECQEYSAKVGRIRCRVEVKTWYRDLVATKRALKYAHRS